MPTLFITHTFCNAGFLFTFQVAIPNWDNPDDTIRVISVSTQKTFWHFQKEIVCNFSTTEKLHLLAQGSTSVRSTGRITRRAHLKRIMWGGPEQYSKGWWTQPFRVTTAQHPAILENIHHGLYMSELKTAATHKSHGFFMSWASLLMPLYILLIYRTFMTQL